MTPRLFSNPQANAIVTTYARTISLDCQTNNSGEPTIVPHQRTPRRRKIPISAPASSPAIAPPAAAERPGFAWFFGRDSMWTSLAYDASGDFASARLALDFLSVKLSAPDEVPANRARRQPGPLVHRLSLRLRQRRRHPALHHHHEQLRHRKQRRTLRQRKWSSLEKACRPPAFHFLSRITALEIIASAMNRSRRSTAAR